MGSSVSAEDVYAVQALLEKNDLVASVVRYDMHAILNGWDTIGHYDMMTWHRLKRALSAFSPETLTETIGPALRP